MANYWEFSENYDPNTGSSPKKKKRRTTRKMKSTDPRRKLPTHIRASDVRSAARKNGMMK